MAIRADGAAAGAVDERVEAAGARLAGDAAVERGWLRAATHRRLRGTSLFGRGLGGHGKENGEDAGKNAEAHWCATDHRSTDLDTDRPHSTDRCTCSNIPDPDRIMREYGAQGVVDDRIIDAFIGKVSPG
jgi:hypothetical protein